MSMRPRPPLTFSALFSIGPAQEALFATLTRVELLLKVRALNRECRDWVDVELVHASGGDALGCGIRQADVAAGIQRRHSVAAVVLLGRGIRPADVAAGIHVALLRRFAAEPGVRVLLHPAVYELEGDEQNAAHLHNEPRGEEPDGYGDASEEAWEEYDAWEQWEAEWREGYGPLQIAVGVTIVGQELHGVQLEGDQARLQVRTESVRFVSMTFPRGVEIGSPQQINGASLVMDDCRVFGSGGVGVVCGGKVEATRCRFENNGSHGVLVYGGEAKLVECVVRNNGGHGLSVGVGKATVAGGTVSDNKGYGVLAYYRSKVTVAAAEHSEEVNCEQTVSSGNVGHDWATQGGSEIEGLAEGIQAVAV